jgi:hypothetical protein
MGKIFRYDDPQVFLTPVIATHMSNTCGVERFNNTLRSRALTSPVRIIEHDDEPITQRRRDQIKHIDTCNGLIEPKRPVNKNQVILGTPQCSLKIRIPMGSVPRDSNVNQIKLNNGTCRRERLVLGDG